HTAEAVGYAPGQDTPRPLAQATEEQTYKNCPEAPCPGEGESTAEVVHRVQSVKEPKAHRRDKQTEPERHPKPTIRPVERLIDPRLEVPAEKHLFPEARDEQPSYRGHRPEKRTAHADRYDHRQHQQRQQAHEGEEANTPAGPRAELLSVSAQQ